MPSFELRGGVATESSTKNSTNPEMDALVDKFRAAVLKYRTNVKKISGSSDIKYIELGRMSKEEAYARLEDIKKYMVDNKKTELEEGLRVLINVLGSIDDLYEVAMNK